MRRSISISPSVTPRQKASCGSSPWASTPAVVARLPTGPVQLRAAGHTTGWATLGGVQDSRRLRHGAVPGGDLEHGVGMGILYDWTRALSIGGVIQNIGRTGRARFDPAHHVRPERDLAAGPGGGSSFSASAASPPVGWRVTASVCAARYGRGRRSHRLLARLDTDRSYQRGLHSASRSAVKTRTGLVDG